jgi:hypothetical protein
MDLLRTMTQNTIASVSALSAATMVHAATRLLLLLLLLPLLLPPLQLQDTIWLPAEGHAALLQLAINCSSARTANAAAVCLPTTECLGPELLQPTVARKLLVTAATRQHTAAVVYMAELPLMQQQIDATTLEAVIRQLPEHEQCVQALCALPAAVQLSSDTIAGLLLAVLHATTFSGTYCWGAEVASAAGHLCKLPAAQQLSSKHINSLLRACMQLNIYPYRGTRFVVAVCQLPGAKQLSSGTIVQLLQEAISVKGSDYTQQLCSLPAAAAISGADATSLVSAVCMLEGVDHGMQHNLDSITHRLVRLPAIAQLDNMELGQLLRVLVTNIKPKSFLSYIGLHFLCTLPAAQQLSSEVVEQLLEAALARNNVRCTGVLFTLPGIEQLSSAAVARLLQAAVQAKDSGSINTLVSMTAAAAFSSERAAELLQAAVQCSAGVECIRALTHLPAAAFLDSDQLAAVLKGVAAHCNVACIAQLCSLPAAMQLSGEQITPAVEAAVQRGAAGCISQLMTLPAAKQVRSEAVQALLQTAHQLSDSKRAKCQALLQKMLKAAQQQQQQQH